MTSKIIFMAAALALTLPPPAWAVGAHEHGVAELAIAMENSVVEMEFSVPAMNIVGFEHRARTEDEQQKVQQASASLAEADALFQLRGSCVLESAAVDATEPVADSHYQNGHHEHDHHGHSAPESHGNFTALYRWQCSQTEGLQAIYMTLFERFHSIKKVQVMWVGDAGQGSASVTSANPLIKLR